MERTGTQVWEASMCGVGWKMCLVRGGGISWDAQIPGSAADRDRIRKVQCIWEKMAQMW